MSIVVVYHDYAKAVVASDDRVCAQDLGTLETHAVDGRVCKIVVLPRTLVFGTVGRLDVSQRLFSGTAQMCRERHLGFEQLTDALPPILDRVWNTRTPLPAALGVGMNQQDSLLLGVEAGKIRCRVFLSEKKFEPIETTAAPENRVAIIGAFNVLDEKLFREFTGDVGLRGQTKRAPWIAARMRDLIDSISALHPESIGKASYFAALNRDGFLELPPDFPPPPDVPSPSRALAGARATSGRFFLGSILTPAAGGPDTVGHDDGGVGAQGGTTTILPMSTVVSASGGNGAVANPTRAIDGDPTTFAALTATAVVGGANQSAQITLSAAAGVDPGYESADLVILYAVPVNTLGGAGPTGPVTFIQVQDAIGSVLASSYVNVGGGTLAIGKYTFSIPRNTNLSQLKFFVGVHTVPSPGGTGACTTGAVELDVYDAYIKVVS